MPDLFHCSPHAASVVMEELAIMWPHDNAPAKLRPDYARVQNALEHQYQCLGVTCDEIGGFLNQATGDYYEETRPCGGYGVMISQRRDSVAYTAPSSSILHHNKSFVNDHKSGLAVSSFLLALALFGVTLTALVATVRDRSRSNLATRLVSGVVSRADYWWSSSSSNNTYNMVDSDPWQRPN